MHQDFNSSNEEEIDIPLATSKPQTDKSILKGEVSAILGTTIRRQQPFEENEEINLNNTKPVVFIQDSIIPETVFELSQRILQQQPTSQQSQRPPTNAQTTQLIKTKSTTTDSAKFPPERSPDTNEETTTNENQPSQTKQHRSPSSVTQASIQIQSGKSGNKSKNQGSQDLLQDLRQTPQPDIQDNISHQISTKQQNNPNQQQPGNIANEILNPPDIANEILNPDIANETDNEKNLHNKSHEPPKKKQKTSHEAAIVIDLEDISIPTPEQQNNTKQQDNNIVVVIDDEEDLQPKKKKRKTKTVSGMMESCMNTTGFVLLRLISSFPCFIVFPS